MTTVAKPSGLKVSLVVLSLWLTGWGLNLHAKTVAKKPHRPTLNASQPAVGPALPSLLNLTQLSQWETFWLGPLPPTTPAPPAPVEARLARLETLVFGTPKPTADPLLGRWQALERAYQQAYHPPELPPAQTNTETETETAAATPPLVKQAALPGETYPVVDTLEKKVLGQAYPKLPLGQRLNQLEKPVFGAPVDPHLAYSDRVERLKNAVFPNGLPVTPTRPQAVANNQPTFTIEPVDEEATTLIGQNLAAEQLAAEQTSTEQTNTLNPQRLAALEAKIIHQTFAHEAQATRLARLETTLFGQVSPNTVGPQQRLERLEAVQGAEKSGGIASIRNGRAAQILLPVALTVLLILF